MPGEKRKIYIVTNRNVITSKNGKKEIGFGFILTLRGRMNSGWLP